MHTQFRGRDFISIKGWSKEDLETILHVAFDLKAKQARREPHPLLAGKELGMIFCYPSTRTRISFETGMSQLGGHAQYYAPEHTHIGGLGESWEDMSKVMSRYLDGITARIVPNPKVAVLTNLKWGEAHKITETIAASASIPVINAADDMEHPCQMMADIMTIIEKFGAENYRKKKVAMIATYKNTTVRPGVAQSLLLAGGALGMQLTFAYPTQEYAPDDNYVAEGKKLAALSGGSIEVVHDIDKAVKDADVIYAKAWGAIRVPQAEDDRIRSMHKDWCIRPEHFKRAAPGAIFMNPMPIGRGEEAMAEVVDGPMSVIVDEAENRLHAQKAVMSLIM